MKITRILAPLALLALAGCASKTPATSSNAVNAVGVPATANRVGDPLTMTTPPPGVQKPQPTPTLMNARDMKPDLKNYRVRGQIKGLEKSAADGLTTLIVNHENIPDFMPAMEMRVPIAKTENFSAVKAGDKIVFDMNRSTLEVSKIEKLPPATVLKLKK